MNNSERAEKMVQVMLVGLGEGKSYYEYFLSHLDEAVAETRHEALLRGQMVGTLEGFALAVEKAIAIYDRCSTECECGKLLRALRLFSKCEKEGFIGQTHIHTDKCREEK